MSAYSKWQMTATLCQATPHQGDDNLQSVNIDDIFDDVVDEPSKMSRMLSTNETRVIAEIPEKRNKFCNCL